MYLICNNGYLTWPTTIFPHAHFDSTTLEGFFSTNLESVVNVLVKAVGITTSANSNTRSTIADVNYDLEKTSDDKLFVRTGLCSIKNVGNKALNSIIEELKLFKLFSKTRKIRQAIVKAGQDIDSPNFGRKY